MNEIRRVVAADMLNNEFVVSEFELQLRYCVHFWTNSLRKGRNFLIPPAIG